MAVYTYTTANILTGQVIEEIPFDNVRWSKVLNGPGGFSGSIDSRHPKAVRENLYPGKRFLYVLRNGVPVWAGIIWVARFDNGNIQVAAQGIWSYFRHRRIRIDKLYEQEDQLYIARDLLDYAQSATLNPGGDIGVVVGSETAGIDRDRNYYGFERKPIGEAIEQLAAVENGFDFSIETTESGGAYTHTFVPEFPYRGRRTSWTWEVGVHCDLHSWEIDADRMANRMDALGAGDGESMLIATATNATLLSEFPLLDDTTSYRDVIYEDTLQEHADAWLIRRQLPLGMPSITLRSTPETKIGSFIEGDEVQVTKIDGWSELDGWYRIIGYEVQVSEEGDEAVKVDFLGPEAMP